MFLGYVVMFLDHKHINIYLFLVVMGHWGCGLRRRRRGESHLQWQGWGGAAVIARDILFGVVGPEQQLAIFISQTKLHSCCVSLGVVAIAIGVSRL
jgi:hypothetical protein